MKQKLFVAGLCFLILVLTPLISSQEAEREAFQKLFGVEVVYENNAFSIENVFIDFGYKTKGIDTGDYIIRTLDKRGNVLNELYFNLPEISSEADPSWFDPTTGEQIIIPEAPEFSFQNVYYMPYNEDIKYVGIYEDAGEKELIKVNIKDFVICGDGVCQKGEDEIICQRDCGEAEEGLVKKIGLNWFSIALLTALVLIVIIVIYIIYKIKKRREENLDFSSLK